MDVKDSSRVCVGSRQSGVGQEAAVLDKPTTYTTMWQQQSNKPWPPLASTSSNDTTDACEMHVNARE